ncbi:UNVERIFIED_ORG: hypothetical protein ABIB21_003074 [Arthrobacter sp. UYEF13]
MTSQYRAAPDLEIVLMYRQGIKSPKIAAHKGMAESSVRYHLALAAKADPGLRGAHKAALGTVTRQTAAGPRNLNDVVAFFEAEGLLPTTGGKTARERALGFWLHRLRQLSDAGTLSPIYREGLSVTPGWDAGPSFRARHEARWEHRLLDLVTYRAAGNDWPRHQKTDDAHERSLGVWLHVQRISHRQGKLYPEREARLEAMLPGWLEGRAPSGGRRTTP